MALEQTRQDGSEEEVEGEIEAVEPEGGQDAAPQTETIRLSRRKREQQEREEREQALKADLESRRAETERLRQELYQTRETQARMQGALEQLQRQPRERDSERESAPVDLRDKVEELRRAASEALGKSDLDAWQRHQEAIMDAKAEMKARAIVAAQRQAAPVPQQQQPQKPDWVRAVEYQYPEVLTHPRGQHTVGIFDNLLSDEQFGPQRLHKAFQRARQELGLAAANAQAPAASQGSRALHTGITSSGTGPRKATNGERDVKIPKKNLEEMMRAGLTRTQAAKAWAESYPDE